MIYDCFMFFNEFELLDMRLHIMGPHVDRFVLVESRYSHTGNPKPLYFDERKKEFTGKNIIHVIIDDEPNDEPWYNENFHRNCISIGLENANPEDVIIVSDLDEIPNPEAIIKNLHILDERKMFSLKQKLFYFYVNFKMSNSWKGTTVCKKKNMQSPQWMRNKRNGFAVENGGWHYAYLGGEKRVREKIDRVCHSDIDLEVAKDMNHIRMCMENGGDLFNRNKKLRVVPLEGNSPDCIHEFIQKYPKVISEKTS